LAKADNFYKEINDWRIAYISNENVSGCSMTQMQKNGIDLSFAYLIDGKPSKFEYVMLGKRTWNVPPSTIANASIDIDGKNLEGRAAIIGYKESGSIIMSFSNSINNSNLIRKEGVVLSLKAPRQTYQFQLYGTSSAYVEMGLCAGDQAIRDGRLRMGDDQPFSDRPFDASPGTQPHN